MEKEKVKNKETIRYGNYEYRRELFEGEEHFYVRPAGIFFWSVSSKEVFEAIKSKLENEYSPENIRDKMINRLLELVEALDDKIQEVKNDIEEGRATQEELEQLLKERDEAVEDLNERRRIAG